AGAGVVEVGDGEGLRDRHREGADGPGEDGVARGVGHLAGHDGDGVAAVVRRVEGAAGGRHRVGGDDAGGVGRRGGTDEGRQLVVAVRPGDANVAGAQGADVDGDVVGVGDLE